MTGYGKAETVVNGKKITAEIRSLNSKQLDLSVRIPAVYRQTEYEIRSDASRRLKRGKADITVSYEVTDGAGTVTINRLAFADYLRQLREICSADGLAWGDNDLQAAVVPAILRLPEVVQNDAAVIPEEEIAALRRTVTEALDRLDAFRQQEGEILIADLLKRVDKIEELLGGVEPYEKERTVTIKARIRENIEAMNIPVDSIRLEQEMIYYLEKLDVTEEKVRLKNHCRYFREVARGEEEPGRKLGFIAQEIGREINTLGSKANQADIQRIVVQMKDELEKIKEQLLNLL